MESKELMEYIKIETLFERNCQTKKLNEGQFRDETVEFLKDNIWEFTEKIDGTNIRIFWDGHKVSYYGRTNNAQIPVMLMNRLVELFGGDVNEELFEQKFGETPVMLVGEGYGEKIQKGGGNYTKGNEFILFDVFIGGNWQPRSVVNEIAKYFNIQSVPVLFEGNLQKGIDYVKTKPKSTIGKADMEGLVARPKKELRNRMGHRVIVKIKVRDFEEI